MDIMDAIEILKKYGLYDKANNECLQKKIDTAPHDVQGHHNIYCSYLYSKRRELRDEKQELQKTKCKEWDNIPQKLKPTHHDCESAQNTIINYCKATCKFYKDNIMVIENSMKELKEAANILEEATKKDNTYK
jgi:hypothetical protein